MPELPEVETARQGLVPALEGRRLARVRVRRPDLRVPFPKGFAERLTGRRVKKLTRRAKYILAHLDGGEILLMHLGMSGRFSVFDPGQAPAEFAPHDHVVLDTDKGVRVIFTDHRRFGLMTLLNEKGAEKHKLLAGLGPEPLSDAFTPALLGQALEGKRSPIKAALLDQRVVAGLGNIYVCEALFRAGISPQRIAATVARDRLLRLVPAVKRILSEAIEAGGSTLRDHKRTNGELGYFQHSFSVYDREGEPCPAKGCKGHVKRIVQSGRSTFFCAKCQR
jgi:formamidopyrimidine-DNA glycosylase